MRMMDFRGLGRPVALEILSDIGTQMATTGSAAATSGLDQPVAAERHALNCQRKGCGTRPSYSKKI